MTRKQSSVSCRGNSVQERNKSGRPETLIHMGPIARPSQPSWQHPLPRIRSVPVSMANATLASAKHHRTRKCDMGIGRSLQERRGDSRKEFSSPDESRTKQAKIALRYRQTTNSTTACSQHKGLLWSVSWSGNGQGTARLINLGPGQDESSRRCAHPALLGHDGVQVPPQLLVWIAFPRITMSIFLNLY